MVSTATSLSGWKYSNQLRSSPPSQMPISKIDRDRRLVVVLDDKSAVQGTPAWRSGLNMRKQSSSEDFQASQAKS